MHNAKLISLSMPVDKATIPDSQSLLAYFARVSSTATQNNHDTGEKLIKSLVKRKEWSPLEMVDACFEITTTRDIGRQILRHGKAFGFQEFSQRYAKVSDKMVKREARLQHSTDRQKSVETDDNDLQAWWRNTQGFVEAAAQQAYDDALERGIAKEVARAVMPEGMTPTRMYMNGSLRSWYHYCELRCDEKTQKEHRLVAESARAELSLWYPTLFKTSVLDLPREAELIPQS